MKNKAWSGERLETFIFNDNTTEHLHRYAIALSLADNKLVLDIASGEGYGSNLLAAIAKNVIGVDIAPEVIIKANTKYRKSNLTFKQGSAADIPIEDASVDLVVSFETIEHHDQHEKMLSEIKRVLKPSGVLIISSPDKKNYSDTRNFVNPHHVKELYFEEFKVIIRKHFKNSDFFFQKIISGSLILNELHSQSFTGYKGNYDAIESVADFAPHYNLCIASDGVLPTVDNSLFDSGRIADKLVADAVNDLKTSWTYRIGHMLLFPLKIFKKN